MKYSDVIRNNWSQPETDHQPLNRRMKILSDKQIGGMSTENIRFLINETVRLYAQGGTYVEAGCYQGGSLLSAAIFNESTQCIGIDNFSEFDHNGNNRLILEENLVKFDKPSNILFIDGDFQKLIPTILIGVDVDVYFYDANHSYENQLLGLEIVLPFLSDRCIIFVDDINWEWVARANEDFRIKHPEFKILFKVLTEGNARPSWWNGFEVMGRNIDV